MKKKIKGCAKMKKLKRKLTILLIFVIFILMETISLATYQTSKAKEIDKKSQIQKMILREANLTQEEQETLYLINEYRRQNGLTELKPIARLQEVAKLKAEDLVENAYFSHVSPNLGTPFEMLTVNGIEYTVAGENLAGNTTPKRAVEAWLNSPSHKKNILDDEFEYTGIYVIESPIYGKIFVQLFMGLKY